MTMEFRVLGPLEVVRGGRGVQVGTAKMRHILAVLVLQAPHVVSVEKLVDELWPERAPEDAKQTLHSYVSRLRSALPGDILVTRPPGYALEIDTEACDARRFERLASTGKSLLREERYVEAGEVLREALGHWRGPALDGIGGMLVESEASRLNELRLSVVEDRIEADLGAGLDSELVAELEMLTSEHPLRERFWAQLMRALYGGGRQADALAAFARVRDLLVSELGIDPGDELRELEGAILRQDDSLTHAARAVAGALEADGQLDMRGPAGRMLIELRGERITIGRGPGNTIAVQADDRVSARHAVLEREGRSWRVRDVGSRNGTFLNGERLSGAAEVGPGDEIRIGATNLRVLEPGTSRARIPPTVGVSAAPELEPAEQEALVGLCKQVFAGSADAAQDSEVMRGLYAKFSIDAAAGDPATTLANRAVDMGLVRLKDLR